jgi:formate hydrogenlyase transcriptional activator
MHTGQIATEPAIIELIGQCNILDTPPEREFDDLARLAAQVCETSIAVLSIVDANRQWFKAKVNFRLSEAPRDEVFFVSTILQSELFVVSDAAADRRFANHPWVAGEPGIRFYAGVPLIAADGMPLGALCVLDKLPRELTPNQGEALRALSRQAVSLLELRRTTNLLAGAIAENQARKKKLEENRELERRRIEWSPDCISVLDLDGRLLTMNFGGMQTMEICDFASLQNSSWIELWRREDQAAARAVVEAAGRGDIGRFTGYCPTESGVPKWWDVMVSPIRDSASKIERLLAVSRDVTERWRAVETLRVVTEGTATATGRDFFTSLVRHLAQALEVRYSFVAECANESKTQVRMLAFWTGDGFADNVGYMLRGTPCENVIAGDVCCYPEGLPSLFPEDKELVTLKAESYLGVPLRGSSGDVIGHLVVMDDKSIGEMQNYLPILRIFAARAGVELERKRAREALEKSEGHLRTLLDINNAIVSKLTREELFKAISTALGRLIRFDRLTLSLYEPELDNLRIVTYTGPYRRDDYTPIGRVQELGDSPAGWAFLNQKPCLRPDLESERTNSSEERAYGHGFRSLCALPLVVRGKSIGAITVGSLTRFGYTEEDTGFLMEIANQIAIAIDNMRAHEETEELKARFEAEAVYLQEEIKTEHNFEEIIGQSGPMRQLLRKIEQVAPTEATVLIQGETGTGKELLARAIHDRSRRKDRPLVKVNCGSIPSGLVESELFGHEKGAFTGATQRRTGRFELAHEGTIFLDEVTELPIDTQVKLLRVLQEGEFERVGSSQTIKVDVRVIAATNRDLKEVVRNGTFRSDLFYRLNVFPVEAPPLRERKGDIPLLTHFFLSKFSKKLGKEVRGVSQKAMESLKNYNWPGNVRELQNVVERAVVLATGPILKVDESAVRSDGAAREFTVDTLDNVERNHIVRALSETNWVIHGKKGAAAILGINPSTLRSRMEKLGIKKPQSA